MSFMEFLEVTRVLRMLYGLEFAQKYFEENIDKFHRSYPLQKRTKSVQ